MLTKIIIIVALSIAVIGLSYYYFVRSSVSVWIQALLSGAKVSLFDVAYMRLQKVATDDIRKMIDLIVNAAKAGVHIDIKDMELHFLAGGELEKIVEALIEAGNANLSLTARQASAIELAGRDVRQAITMSIKPEIINTPEVSAMAGDGIQLKAWARVTVKSNLDQFVGGVGRDTILARVGQGIVGAIGTAKNHQDIIANPTSISDHIWNVDRDDDNVADLHQDSAYIVESIDIADVNIGANLKASLDAQQAEANQKGAEAFTEVKIAEAVTEKEEMIAREMEAEVERLENEMQVPLAIADAIRNKRLDVRDYFELKNLNADTKMRQAFAALGETKKKSDEHDGH